MAPVRALGRSGHHQEAIQYTSMSHAELLLREIVETLSPVRGVTAIVLGGSRARGDAGPTSDYDIGLLYEPDEPLDIAGLRTAVSGLVDEPSMGVTEIGEWGPWIKAEDG